MMMNMTNAKKRNPMINALVEFGSSVLEVDPAVVVEVVVVVGTKVHAFAETSLILH